MQVSASTLGSRKPLLSPPKFTSWFLRFFTTSLPCLSSRANREEERKVGWLPGEEEEEEEIEGEEEEEKEEGGGTR